MGLTGSEPARGRLVREGAALSVGAGISGIAAYAFAAIGTRTVGADAFAPVSVLWSYWAVSIAAVSFPLQHWVIRRLRVDGSAAGVRAALPRIAAIVLVLSMGSGLLGWGLREDLFRRDGLTFPLYLALVPLGAALIGLTRGRLAGEGRFTATAWAFAGENLLRVALATAGAVAGWDAEAFGAILVAGFGVVIAWPGTFRFARTARTDGDAQIGLLAGIAAGSILAQVVLTGAPVALALLGASPAAITSAFAALALFRAPYVIGTGVASRLTGVLTGFVLEGRKRRLRVLQIAVTAATAGGALLAALFAWVWGLPVLRALFGSGIDLPRAPLLVIAAGSAVAVGTLVQTLVLIGRARWDVIVGSWALALAAAVPWMLLGPGDVLGRVTWAFLIAETVAYLAMMLAETRALRGPALSADAGEIIVTGM